ncbi:sigma-70 family RNA polymerase sigma factor [Sphingobium sp. H39-3-25]|uniref:RNA polymerase sigma factor n=1 Tax=Sphingobium arseniciresistens TaxID=3030834 RepID=UPI0023B8C6F1|nr:sigma-70 family RNA polymerase sigma factor [Sphingobium arseniciresistens]
MTDSHHLAAEARRRTARWVAREILPHERNVRQWLAKARVAPQDADELIQEAYCRLASLEDIDRIESPFAYFFSIVRNLLMRQLKQQRIVPLDMISEIDAYQDERPSPEELADAGLTYGKILQLISQLPDRCRRIVELRKIEGWTQREIADHLGTTEKAVEKQVWLGIRAVRLAWKTAEEKSTEDPDFTGHRKRSH